MFLYVFENVLTDYTSGMVVIAANTLEQALDYAAAEYGGILDQERDLEQRGGSPGWNNPTVYAVADTVPHGIRHEVFGGS